MMSSLHKEIGTVELHHYTTDLDRRYMPEGQPVGEVSSRGTSDAHRAELKTNATGISRSLSEVFAYLTHGTASLEEAKTLLSIITNVFKL